MRLQTGLFGKIFSDTLHAYYRTFALKAALELDLFTLIDRKGDTIETIAHKCHAQPRGIKVLCDYLVSIKFLHKDGQSYFLSPAVQEILSKKSAHYMGSIAEFMLSPTMTHSFLELADIIRHGTPDADQELDSTNRETWLRHARSVRSWFLPSAEEMISLVAK